MLNYLRELPNRSPAARRRFVVAATAFSFTLIILAWIGVLFFGRTPALLPRETAVPATPTPAPRDAAQGKPAAAITPEPQASPLVDVGQISTNLLKAFGEPER